MHCAQFCLFSILTLANQLSAMATLGNGLNKGKKLPTNRGKIKALCNRHPFLCGRAKKELMDQLNKRHEFHQNNDLKEYSGELLDETKMVQVREDKGILADKHENNEKPNNESDELIRKVEIILQDDTLFMHHNKRSRQNMLRNYENKRKVLKLLLRTMKEKDFGHPKQLADKLLKDFHFN